MNTTPIKLFTEKRPVIISGPCSAESEEQVLSTCTELAKTGKVDVLRAGIWKPRTRLIVLRHWNRGIALVKKSKGSNRTSSIRRSRQLQSRPLKP